MVDKHKLIDGNGDRLVPHTLRHNIGNSGVGSNVDVVAIASILGHTDPTTTLRMYYTSSPEAVKAGMSKLSKFFEERDLDQ